MELSIADAAYRLGVSENTLWEFIRSGRLTIDTTTGVPLIPEANLEGVMGLEDTEPAPLPSSQPEVLQSIVQRLGALENQIKVKWDLLRENRHLILELRERDKEIARQAIEIEKLNRDQVYQKRLLEKELEDQQRSLQEQSMLKERQLLEQLAHERAQLERLLALEREHWQERLDREKELYAERLEADRKREGFWSRLVKMMTWS